MRKSYITLTILFIAFSLNAAKQAPVTTLDVKNAQKLEVRHGQIGPRDTLLFYTFKDEKAVLMIRVNNTDKSFPVTANIFLFDKSVTEEGLKKWLNNQHSDGLYPNVPKASNSVKVPAKAFKVISKKVTGKSKGHFGNFENYDIKLKVEGYSDNISVKLIGFTVDTKVHLKVK